MTIVRMEGVGKLKIIRLVGTRTRDIPTCSIVPQPTTLPRAPWETAVLPSSALNWSLDLQVNHLLLLYQYNIRAGIAQSV
jgi:hypothetical protein